MGKKRREHFSPVVKGPSRPLLSLPPGGQHVNFPSAQWLGKCSSNSKFSAYHGDDLQIQFLT